MPRLRKTKGMDIQLGLSGIAPKAPFVRGSETSYEAALAISSKLGVLQRKVLDHVIASENGYTCEELERLIPNSKHQTISARLKELFDAKLVEYHYCEVTGKPETRVNTSHRRARVYFASLYAHT